MKFTFHILCNPYVPSLETNTADAFTQFARQFSKMMTSRGHTTYFYGTGLDNSLVCSEYINCLQNSNYIDTYGRNWDYNTPLQLEITEWSESMNAKGSIISNIYLKHVKKHLHNKSNPDTDLIIHFYNFATYPPLQHLDKYKHIDGMIMSNHGCCPYRIYCSNISLNYNLGYSHGNHELSQKYPIKQCRTIYPFIEFKDFHYDPTLKTGAILYLARVNKFKGLFTFMELAKLFPNKQFWICGNPHPSESGFNLEDYPNVKYWGFADKPLRRKLLSEASCLIQASTYNEPFGFNCIEMMYSGGMCITSNTGAFKETILQGITGFRCDTIADYILAIKQIDTIKPENCHKWVLENFNEEKTYQNYIKTFKDWFYPPLIDDITNTRLDCKFLHYPSV
jgi:glycosyltransferase involved in cell wall biosynthesis